MNCPQCGVEAEPPTGDSNMVRMPAIPGDPTFSTLGPAKCLRCGWIEPQHECSPSCPGWGQPT